MLFLPGNGADAVLFTQGKLVEPGEILYGDCDLVRAALEGHPVDHIHGVVEKMGIDLGLEGIKFRDTQVLRGLGLLFHELVHFPGHVVVGIDEVADLVVGGGTVHRNRRSLADGPHPRDNRRNPVGDGAGKEHGQEKGQHHDSEIDHNKLDGTITGALDETFTAGDLGEFTITEADDGGTEIILGAPLEFNPENIEEMAKLY